LDGTSANKLSSEYLVSLLPLFRILYYKPSGYLEGLRGSYECQASWTKWNNAFRQACLFEIAFFEAGLNGDFAQF
jgi:hypothetical protein